jgi:biotin carboxylase
MSISDYGVRTAALVANTLGLPGTTPNAAHAARDKGAANRLLSGRGVPVARQRVVTSFDLVDGALEDIGLPCVVKPRDEAGGIGVVLVSDAEHARRVIGALVARTSDFRGQPALAGAVVEEYLAETEVSVEIVADGSELIVLGVTDKTIGPAPWFVEVAESFPSMLPAAEVARATSTALAALAAVGHDFGAAHVELKLTHHGPVVVEINPRLAGSPIPRLIHEATGCDVIRELVALHVGLPHRLRGLRAARGAATRHLVAQDEGVVRSVLGVDAARRIPARDQRGRVGLTWRLGVTCLGQHWLHRRGRRSRRQLV